MSENDSKAQSDSEPDNQPKPEPANRNPLSELIKSAEAGNAKAYRLLQNLTRSDDPKIRKRAKEELRRIRAQNDAKARTEAEKKFHGGGETI